MFHKTLFRCIAAAACIACISTSLRATVIELTVTTIGPVGLAPVFASFHDGSHDLFDVGGTATSGLELLAEVGDPTAIIAEADAAGVSNSAGFAPGGPFAPNGGTGSHIFVLSPTETAFSMASMVLPSNDWFIGTDGPINIVSLHGAFPGTALSFPLTTVYDAGTEAEDFAFAPGGGLVGITTASDPSGGLSTTDLISVVGGPDPFASFANLEPAAYDTAGLDFSGAPIAYVQLMVIPEPETTLLMGIGIVGWLGIRRRQSR